MTQAAASPGSIDELCEAVRSAPGRIIACGAGTKPSLIPPDVRRISLTGLTGVVEYEPSEYTFTAFAGTPARDISAILAENGQYLPFDPLFAASGATLGGTIAASASGPGRLRYGGVRDFIIGIRFVDGEGRLLRGGGKVVKNAAGFDFPKLMTGAMGRLGILAEVSFKVFPAPAARLTAKITCRDLTDAVERLCFAAAQNWEAEALEILPPHTLLLRLMGDAAPLAARMDAALGALGRPAEILTDSVAAAFWLETTEFAWVPDGAMLVKIPVTPRRVEPLDSLLDGAQRRYGQAANVAFVAWQEAPAALHEKLLSAGCAGLAWRGSDRPIRFGAAAPAAERLVKGALDATGRFPDFPAFSA